MDNLNHMAEKALVSRSIDIILKKVSSDDRDMEIMNLLDLMEKYSSHFPVNMNFDMMRKIYSDKDGFIYKYINRALDETDPFVLKRFAMTFIYQAMYCGTKKIREMRKIHKCNIPWLILMDPTSACNLHCTGCWAAEYGNRLNLTLDELDSIVCQGKELGVYFYMFTGGEPLVRKSDIIKLCEKHSECMFLAFTNGTLVDEPFCKEMKRVGNFALAISLEGEPEVNDRRRGDGVYRKVMHAMDLLKENGLIFGTSICYTSQNYKSVTDQEFIQLMVNKGCKYALYFHYMPVGNDASPDLLPSPEERSYVMRRTRKIRSISHGEGLFTMDFQNDGEFVEGCIAGGRNYFHINANGDAEPCVFIHYSNANIRTHSLLEILHQPIFMAYYDNQPFNKNHLRPCPMLENPEILTKLVEKSNAHSTDLQSPETAGHLCDKCRLYADNWKICAEKLWNDASSHHVNKYENYKEN